MTPKNPENFVKVSQLVSEIFGILHFTKVSSNLTTESLYSDEYSFTLGVVGVEGGHSGYQEIVISGVR